MNFHESILVGLADRSYRIHIGSGILDRLPEFLTECRFPTNIALISNRTVYNLYGDILLSILENVGYTVSVIDIEDGEQYKNIATLSRIYDDLVDSNVDRGSGVIALGGGVVGDIAGFAAATYLRGIPYIQLPTTLLSQVDSSVGGKTAINHPRGKNLIGAFYQPELVCIDIDTLQSLPEREFNAGMAEVIKYGVIRDRAFFNWLKSNRDAIRDKEPPALIHAIKTSCQIKADIVEIDEKESSLRAILNFGHTLGHAVEALTDYRQYLHGEAVAIGMVAAAEMSHELGHCSAESVDEIRALLSMFDLPVALPGFTAEDYLDAMKRDKKVKGGTLTMVFNQDIGDCLVATVDSPAALIARIVQPSE